MRSKNYNFYITIIDQIKVGKSPYTVPSFSRQRLHYYIKRMLREGIISKIGYGTWEVKKDVKNSSARSSDIFTKPIFNLHAMNIRIPILSGQINDKEWKSNKGFRNWIPKYTNIELEAESVKVQDNNGKSITLRIKSRNLNSIEEKDKLAFKMRDAAFYYFKAKYGVTLDRANAEIKNIDLATEDEKIAPMRRKSDRFELDLRKPAQKTFKKDNYPAKAWLDSTPFPQSVETNDAAWAKEYLSMPFSIRDLRYSLPALQEYNRNLKLHIKVMEDIRMTLKQMRDNL